MNAARTIALIGLLATAAYADVTVQPVALSGAPAPGFPAGVTFSFFSDPRVNSAGHIAFWAELAGTGISSTNAGTAWSDRSGLLALVTQTGNPAQGTTNTVTISIPGPAFNNADRLAWPASLVPSDLSAVPINIGLYDEDASATATLLAREGEPAPGLAANYAYFTSLTLTNSGEIDWQANAGAAAWSASTTSPAHALVVHGAPATGVPGSTFDYIDSPGVGPSGRPVARSTTIIPPTTRSMGLWDVSDSPTPIALVGAAAPGGSTYLDFDAGPAACTGDCIAFYARTVGATTPVPGIYAGSLASPGLIARAGDVAPGTGGLTFASVAAHPALSALGHVAFFSHLAGATSTNNSALYATDAAGANLHLLAREDDQAPRLPSGTHFASFNEPALNSAGQVAFLAHLRGAAVSSANNCVLYATDRSGRLAPIVRTGDQIDLGSGARTVEEIIFDSDAAAAGRSQFADASTGGVLVFELAFKDTIGTQVVRSSGVFSAHIRCLADIDGVAGLNVGDFTAMLQAFSTGNLRAADFNGNGILEVNDFITFLQAFALGCH